ncbi:MAG: TIGR02996 domain-containing protein [Planctomycetales bacterium]|nr:TIGR02996 domain-containing protein [Planctomycetales bacterium]
MPTRDEYLQAIIAAADDDLTPYAVFADWLYEQGDPQGEFIQLSLQLEDESLPRERRAELQTRAEALHQSHQRAWLEALAPTLLDQPEPDPRRPWLHPQNSCSFDRGLLHSLEIELFESETLRQLQQTEAARLLRKLTISGMDYDNADIFEEQPVSLDSLREFHFSDSESGGCHLPGDSVHQLIVQLPRIELIRLDAHNVATDHLFASPLPHLKSLEANCFHDYDVIALAGNPSLGKLERVAFHPHALEPGEVGAYLNLDKLRSLCESQHLKSLKHLKWMCTDFGDEGIELLIHSRLWPQLETLDLTYGSMTDAGAELLATAPLGHLKKLRVNGNYLTDAGVRQLSQACPVLEADHQLTGDPGAPAAEHLWYGDME